MDYRTIAEGYSASGVFWQIVQPKLRYAKIFEVRVNGVSTPFRSRDAAYKFLEESKVTSFTKVAREGKVEYEYQQRTAEELQAEADERLLSRVNGMGVEDESQK